MYIREMRGEEYLKKGLQATCNYVNSLVEVKKVCEIGTYRGESTTIFLNEFKTLEEYVGVDPYSIDFNSDDLFTPELVKQIENEFLEKIKDYPSAKLLKKSSVDASKDFPDQYFDFIYIDGCHQEASVISDINSWLPKVKKGGFISFHDIDNNQVQSAISKFFSINTGHITEDQSITFGV
jgi:predicted O-methyltransferase YrrM